MGAERTTPVVLGPVTWVHLARHADAQASDEATVALKKEYLQAILPVYEVNQNKKNRKKKTCYIGYVVSCLISFLIIYRLRVSSIL